jgi:hypothetical protein
MPREHATLLIIVGSTDIPMAVKFVAGILAIAGFATARS